jgi:hypothetical protein
MSFAPSPSQRLVALYVILYHLFQCCNVSIPRREVHRLSHQMRTQWVVGSNGVTAGKESFSPASVPPAGIALNRKANSP